MSNTEPRPAGSPAANLAGLVVNRATGSSPKPSGGATAGFALFIASSSRGTNSASGAFGNIAWPTRTAPAAARTIDPVAAVFSTILP